MGAYRSDWRLAAGGWRTAAGNDRIEEVNMSDSALKDVIQQKYGEAARRAAAGEDKGGCCGTGCGCADPITSDLYGAAETSALPAEAVAASLGCGNPTALIDLHEGDTVLDL